MERVQLRIELLLEFVFAFISSNTYLIGINIMELKGIKIILFNIFKCAMSDYKLHCLCETGIKHSSKYQGDLSTFG